MTSIGDALHQFLRYELVSQATVLILGPTAGGKTDLAIALALELPGCGEVVTCDSMQVYRGMDIGTAKPTPAQCAAVRHHLIDIADPSDDTFSVDRWLSMATAAISDIRSRGRWPIVVGGTNLFVQSLLRGMADVPPPDFALRRELQSLEPAALRARLLAVDRDAALRIHPNDTRRTIRAIEVHAATGQPLSQFQTQWSGDNITGGDMVVIGIEYEVGELNRRINARVKQMIESGLVEEVRRLHERVGLGRTAREALGYKQLVEHLEGRCPLEEAIEQIKIRTRRYAKQQRTWLRRFKALPLPSQWIPGPQIGSQTIVNQLVTWIVEDRHNETRPAEAELIAPKPVDR